MPYKEITLKNKKIVRIREAQISDAKHLLECIRTYVPESDFIPKLGSEIKLTLEQEEAWIRSFLESPTSLLLIAEYEGKIIANIDLAGNRRMAMQHTAVIGMGMIKDWRNSGLGTALLASVIEWAKSNPVLEIIWLQVYTENTAGLSLYKKMGFLENGIIKSFFKQNGKYFDNLTMSLDVRNI